MQRRSCSEKVPGIGLLEPEIPRAGISGPPELRKNWLRNCWKVVLASTGNCARKFQSTGFSGCTQKDTQETAKERRGFGSGSNRIFWSDISIFRIFRATGISGCDLYRNFRVVEAANGQILGRAINTPSLPQEQLALLLSLSPQLQESSNHQDLPIPPPKFVDTWRIEGEGPDLLLHRSDLHFLPIHLGISWLGFPLGKPSSPLLPSWCCFDLLWSLTCCGDPHLSNETYTLVVELGITSSSPRASLGSPNPYSLTCLFRT